MGSGQGDIDWPLSHILPAVLPSQSCAHKTEVTAVGRTQPLAVSADTRWVLGTSRQLEIRFLLAKTPSLGAEWLVLISKVPHGHLVAPVEPLSLGWSH